MYMYTGFGYMQITGQHANHTTDFKEVQNCQMLVNCNRKVFISEAHEQRT